MTARAAFSTIIALVTSGVACSLIVDFPAEQLAERTNALCTNGEDDDQDGLMDCADWECVGVEACCDLPAVILDDRFDAPACALAVCGDDRTCAPEPSRWQLWGAPDPYLCDGAFVAAKSRANCFPVGVLSRASVPLRSGIELVAHVSGIPEPAGRFDIGLTLQSEIPGNPDQCAAFATVTAAVSVTYAASASGGVRVIANIDGQAYDEMDLVEAASHSIRIAVQDDRRFHLDVDGIPMAIAPEVIPPTDLSAHVVLFGTGTAARVDDVRLVAGTQCDLPAAWAPSIPFVTLGQTPGEWDDFDQANPNVSDADGHPRLTYAGCRQGAAPACDTSQMGIGCATTAADGTLVRCAEELAVHERRRVLDVTFGQDTDAYLSREEGQKWLERVDVIDGKPIIERDDTPILPIGPDGAWNDYRVCCPSIVVKGGDRYLYFAGRREREATWRIGVAVSRTGGPFEPLSQPVLAEGTSGASDDDGVSEPTVIYSRGLFRMWYTAHAVFGRTSIGYAVSPDGVTWKKYPGNPVVVPEPLGLTSIGGPAVFADDGRMRLWIHGTAPGEVGREIYELENRGEPFAP